VNSAGDAGTLGINGTHGIGSTYLLLQIGDEKGDYEARKGLPLHNGGQFGLPMQAVGNFDGETLHGKDIEALTDSPRAGVKPF
jgi:hypothetical protein